MDCSCTWCLLGKALNHNTLAPCVPTCIAQGSCSAAMRLSCRTRCGFFGGERDGYRILLPRWGAHCMGGHVEVSKTGSNITITHLYLSWSVMVNLGCPDYPLDMLTHLNNTIVRDLQAVAHGDGGVHCPQQSPLHPFLLLPSPFGLRRPLVCGLRCLVCMLTCVDGR